MPVRLLQHRWGWFLNGTTTLFVVAAFVLLGAAGLLAQMRFLSFEESSWWVDHAHQVQVHIQTVQSALADAESDHRGYLLTGDQAFLKSYRTPVATVAVEVAWLRQHTGDNPAQQGRLDALEPLLQRTLTLMQESVATRSRGQVVPAERLIENKRVMNENVAALRHMHEAEEALLQQRLDRTAAIRDTTMRVLLGSTVLGMAMFGAAVLLVNRSIARRLAVERSLRESEASLRQAHDELEERVRNRTADLKRVNASLHAAEQRLQHVVLSSPAVLFTLGVKDGQVLGISWISGNIESMLGYRAEETLGADWWLSTIHLEDRARVADKFDLEIFIRDHCVSEYRLRHKDGRYRWLRCESRLLRDAAGLPTEAVGSWSDITDRKQLEEQFLQSQKMEAVGRLAGGIAHDFNNLLTVISGYSQMVLTAFPAGGRNRALVQEIYEAAQRAAALTQQMLAFSRKQIVQPKVLDLNAAVADARKMLERLIGEDVALTTVLAPDLAPVMADPGQIQQVIMNLAVNARDAMPQGGKLTIETANVRLDEAYTESHLAIEPGRYVLLAVSDTGHGMDEWTKAHIFEPFFTTKDPGKGTGLGLATVYGVVKQNGGSIGVYSELGVGSAFKIYLPAALGQVAPAQSLAGTKPVLPGRETVLLVEDEAAVRSLARQTLRVHGYTVLEAANGDEALRVSDAHAGPIHLLLTDVVMPGRSGRQMAEVLCQRRPDLKVLFVSGYTDDAVVRHGILESEAAFLQKPFTPAALGAKVREVLDKPD